MDSSILSINSCISVLFSHKKRKIKIKREVSINLYISNNKSGNKPPVIMVCMKYSNGYIPTHKGVYEI